MNKRIGNYEVSTYTDSAAAVITHHLNASVTESVRIHGEDDLRDLEYALEVIRREIIR